MSHGHKHGGLSTEGSFDPSFIFDNIDLKKGSMVLDAGCGDGYISMLASRVVGERGRVFSFDRYEKGIAILQKRIEHGNYQNIEAKVKDILEPLPIDDLSLDLIIFSNVFHGFVINEETGPILRMINDKLKKEGNVAIIEFVKEISSIGPDLSEKVSSDELGKILESIDMEVKDTLRISDDHYLSIFSRKSIC